MFHFFIGHLNASTLFLPLSLSLLLSISPVHNLSIRLKSPLSCGWGPHCVSYLSQQGGWKEFDGGEGREEERKAGKGCCHVLDGWRGGGQRRRVDCIYLCVRVFVCVPLRASARALYSLLYCCLSLKQKLSGADRLAASLITTLSSSSPPPQTRSLLIFHKWIVPLFLLRLTVFACTQKKVQLFIFWNNVRTLNRAS